MIQVMRMRRVFVPIQPRIGSFWETTSIALCSSTSLTTSCSSSFRRKLWPILASARIVEIPVPVRGSAGARGEWH